MSLALPAVPWRQVLTPTLLASFVGIILVLLVTLFIGIRNLQSVHATGGSVTQTYSVELAMEELLTTLVDAETGERGFIITGAASYLAPYTRAQGQLGTMLMRVRSLAADDRGQRADVDRLSALAALKMQELTGAIAQRRTAGLAAAQAEVETNVGKRTMDQIRAIVDRMEAREQTLLAVRAAAAEQNYRTARLTEFGTTALAVVAVIALFVGTFRYGAMRLKATRAAEAQQEQLREALQQKDEFVALVSHELRTPVNTVAGWARMLATGTMKPDQAGRAIEMVSRSADALRQLIDDLLDTSQLLSGRMRLSVAPVRLEEVVRDAIETVRLSASNKGVVITDAIQSDIPPIRGDRTRLSQVVWNLLSNAIKFTPAGGHVTVGLTSSADGPRLQVLDTGEGIDPAFLPHVFERYRQAAVPTSSQRGVGLGLAIVRHLVELHGGTVEAHSAGRGQGSTFVVELPFVPVADAVRTTADIREA